MSIRTITAMFDSADAANLARQRLLELGLSSGDVQVIREDAGDERAAADHKGMWESIKDFFTGDGDRATYEEGMRRGGQLLTARVQDEDADEVLAVLDKSDAVNLNQRAQEWRSEGWTGTAATGTATFEPTATADRSAGTSQAGTEEDAVVSKDSEVTEEVVVGKFEGQRTEGVSDTARRTEAEVEDTSDNEELRDDNLASGAGSSNRAPDTRPDRSTRQ
jgi:Domain of unknown function (DUF2382)